MIAFIYIVFYSSCANTGMPTGGPKDSIPPKVVRVNPSVNSVNVRSNKVRIYFDEYVVADKLNEVMVVSPPQKKRPTFKMKGKSLEIELKDSLREDMTYSIDFKNAIVDNNEKNPLENFRIAFSTGNKMDSLRISGYVLHANNLERYENCFILLYKNHADSAFIKTRPDYIAKTDEEGKFTVTNIAAGKYAIYALDDQDKDLKYTPGGESMAFLDSLIVPKAILRSANDTIIQREDTVVVNQVVDFLPRPFHFMASTEEVFNRYLDTYERKKKNLCRMVFSQPVDDHFKVEALGAKEKEWYLLETGLRKDTINLWLTDSILIKNDSLRLAVSYMTPDSLQQPMLQTDTLMFYHKTVVDKSKKRKKKKGQKQEIPSLQVNDNTRRDFDINKNIDLKFSEPLAYLDTSMVRLYEVEDTIESQIPYTIIADSVSLLKHHLQVDWKPETNYHLVYDSAAIQSVYGTVNRPFDKVFHTQKESYYGLITVAIQNLKEDAAIVQLIKPGKEETIVQEKRIDSDAKVTFEYIHPGKYTLKLILDSNRNGKWDAGSFLKKIQPERVFYYTKEYPVRSDWSFEEDVWTIDRNSVKPKPSKKELKEKEEKEKEKQGNRSGRSRLNNTGRSNSDSNGFKRGVQKRSR
ncbi:hypothetical protein EMN47_06615 [Prolixibacteraceae bacterium JC049]|nr:hypothetical protein [Prolixibacteraceae bacterium JC049]